MCPGDSPCCMSAIRKYITCWSCKTTKKIHFTHWSRSVGIHPGTVAPPFGKAFFHPEGCLQIFLLGNALDTVWLLYLKCATFREAEIQNQGTSLAQKFHNMAWPIPVLLRGCPMIWSPSDSMLKLSCYFYLAFQYFLCLGFSCHFTLQYSDFLLLTFPSLEHYP